jgi:hypothetical protein
MGTLFFGWEVKRAPQGYVLCSLLCSLFTHNCVAVHDSSTIVKFADDTTPPSTELVESLKFLGVHFTKELTWFIHTDAVMKKARQYFFPLRRLIRFVMGPQILKKFYSCLVWKLLVIRPQGATEGSAYGPVHHWVRALCHSGPLYQAVSEEGPRNSKTPVTQK